ncbi:DUF3558 domain-containing protein [Rhodococcus sp. NPDC058505]|uniref:DUF3558 domain-containing protein n=1 Tax=Rhodococcus sp. NPDC058505 TaxID=3346531 RepID=UPI00364B152A
MGILLFAAAAVAVAGCGTVSGEAGPEQPTASNPAFDPCDDIPDDAIRAVGMDPATESRDILGVHQPGWNLCGWNNATHFLSVLATNYSIEDVRRNADYESFSDSTIGERSVVQYHDATDRAGTDCDLATASAGGAVVISVSESGERPADQQPCSVVWEAATTLLPFVPE